MKIFIGTSLFLIFVSAFLCLKSPITYSVNNGKRISAILVGCDEVKGSKHSDTLLFVSYNPQKRFMDFLSIPRDTRIEVPDIRLKRISQIYSYFYRKERSSELTNDRVRNVLSNFLGEEIPFYFQINYDFFKNIVNIMGGVNVEIVEEMHYDDTWGNLHIHFSTGEYLLDGQRALEYVRYRDSKGDTGRIERQQSFLRKFQDKIKSPLLIFKIPKLLKNLTGNITTNISLWDFFSLLYEAKDVKFTKIRFQMLPGKPSRTGEWLCDKERLKETMDLILHDIPLPKERTEEKIVIEIFNASGKAGLASQLREKIISSEIDVIKIGDYSVTEFRDKTVVIDRRGNLEFADKIATLIKSKEITTILDKSRDVDVTIIIGKDFKIPKQIWQKE